MQITHGGSRPPQVASDGRFNPNRIVAQDLQPGDDSHHIYEPGAWMPRARVSVPDDELRDVGVPWPHSPLSIMAYEDLMPYERRFLGS